MRKCWNESPEERPTFSQLRSKFSNLLIATSSGTYIVLEVDENKPYYTMGGEEEEEFNRERRNSVFSTNSEIRNEEIRKPKWALQGSNAYVATPSGLDGYDHFHIPNEDVENREAEDSEISAPPPPQQASNVGSTENARSPDSSECHNGVPINVSSQDRTQEIEMELMTKPKS